MLVIRFFRIGKKNQPSFKIVVTEKRNPPRGGRFVEEVGFYNPLTKEKGLKKERIQYWMSQGAKPSDTVYNLLIKEGVIDGKKIPVHKKAKKLEEDKKEEAPKQEQPKPEEKTGEEKAPSTETKPLQKEEVKEEKKEAPAKEEVVKEEPKKEEKKEEVSKEEPKKE